MALDWENIDHWEAGEIALLTLIAFLLALLCSMLICIVYYGKIYHNLKRNEGKPLFASDDGDGPTYNPTARPNSYNQSTDDEEDQFEESQQNNINMANKDMQKSFGQGSLNTYNRTGNMLRYNTVTHTTNQTAQTSTDSDSNSMSTESESESCTDTHTHSRNRNRHINDQSNTNSNDEDDDIGGQYNNRRRHLRPYNNYNPIQGNVPYLGGYGNEMMQQQINQQHHHNRMAFHNNKPPPPGTVYNNKAIAINPKHHNRQSNNSDTLATMTSLTSITGTEPRNRNSVYASDHPINSHLDNGNGKYTPSPKEQFV